MARKTTLSATDIRLALEEKLEQEAREARERAWAKIKEGHIKPKDENGTKQHSQ